jgi:hypothetical protein
MLKRSVDSNAYDVVREYATKLFVLFLFLKSLKVLLGTVRRNFRDWFDSSFN